MGPTPSWFISSKVAKAAEGAKTEATAAWPAAGIRLRDRASETCPQKEGEVKQT